MASFAKPCGLEDVGKLRSGKGARLM